MKISLQFKHRPKEEEFMRSKLPFHSKSLKYISTMLLLQNLQMYFLVPMSMESSDLAKMLPLFFLMPVLIILLILIGWKYPNFSEKAISVAIFLFGMISAELIHHISSEFEELRLTYSIVETNQQFLIIALLLAKISWFRSLVIISFINTYSWLRALIGDSKENSKTSIIFFFLQLILIMAFSYFNEKEDRKFFVKFESKCFQLNNYEEIMKDAIPNSIIIMKKDHVVFFNNFTRKTFEISEGSQILDILRKIKVLKRSRSHEGSDFKSVDEQISLMTLYELYKNCEASLSEIDGNPIPIFKSVEAELASIFEETSKTFSVQIGPTYWKDELGILIIINDISHIKSFYKSFDSYKDNLLATVAHDLRAPLNGIMGMMDLLLSEINEESQREKLNISIVSAKLMQIMINDILDFSLIAKGKMRLKFETTNISVLMNEILKILSLQAKFKGLVLEIDNQLMHKDENHILDANRLKQVLFNLIGNAIKYTNKGKVIVRVREETGKPSIRSPIPNLEISNDYIDFIKEKEEDSEPGRVLLFEVEDTGIGLREEDINKLFKLFSRVTAGHDSSMTGIGLGLAISQSLVIMMNSGRKEAIIRAESTFGKGSKFKFPIYIGTEPSEAFRDVLDEKLSLPIFFEVNTLIEKNEIPAQSPKNHIETEDNRSEMDCLISKNRKAEILVVDDDQLSLLVASKYLTTEENSISFKLETNGEEAVRLIKEQAGQGLFFDVIFLDCNMPVMDGFQTANILKAMMKERKILWTPIIALTGHSSEDSSSRCIQSGMDLYLCKPYTKNDMMKKIHEATKMKARMIFEDL